MKRIALSLLLLGIVFLMTGPVFAGDGDPDPAVSIRMVITPVQGNAGTEISVSGTGADSTLKVHITLSPQAGSAESALATVEVAPNPDGSFSATLTVPAGTADGRYAVRAEQFLATGGLLHYYWNAFTVGAGGEALLPVTGSVPGTPFTVTAALALLLVVGMAIRGVYAIVVQRD